MYTLKGELKVINDTQQVSDSFKKREFVVIGRIRSVCSNYFVPSWFRIECDLLDQLQGRR
jgi:hypothetical protein